jgi:hypothetical protein
MFAGYAGYPVQPMFMSGQVMGQQTPGMMVHGQQSIGQPGFPTTPYQTYGPVQPGYVMYLNSLAQALNGKSVSERTKQFFF